MLFFPIALGNLPPVGSVRGVRTLGLSDSVTTPPLPALDDCVTIGAGLPPIPAKLVSRIEAGEYIDMTELLPDQLGTIRSPANDDSVRAGRQRRRALSGILEWVQCFATYMAVYCRNQPHRIQDLLGYQTLIIEASLEYQGDGWLGYDRRFRQRAAANPALVWANIDTTLWNLAFAGQASASRCRHCFCLSYTTDQCDWAPEPQPLMAPHMTSYQYLKQQQHFDPQPLMASYQYQKPQQRLPPICKAWNNDPHPHCPIPHCTYRHICGHCFSDTHKGFYCPRAGRSTNARPLFGCH